MRKINVVIPSAGIGSRMQSDIPKQYLKLGQQTVIEHTIHQFLTHPAVDKVIVVVSENDSIFNHLSIHSHPSILITTGGVERAHSVLNGLALVDSEWVLIHDAARPCITHADIDQLVELANHFMDGGILATPVKDTMKRSNQDGVISQTVERAMLWHAMTPQFFQTQQIADALSSALEQGLLITDEASAMEHAGYAPKLVAGRADNIKITVPEDLAFAQFILQQQERLTCV